MSNEGRVRSLDRDVERTSKNGKKYIAHLKGEIKKIKGSINGYKPCSLWKDNEQNDFLVHQLVATAFIPNPNGYTVVHHKNHNRGDNRVENLEWIDKNEHNSMHKRKQVCQFTLDGELFAVYSSIKEATNQTNYDESCISRCCNPSCKSYKTYKGYKWEFRRC